MALLEVWRKGDFGFGRNLPSFIAEHLTDNHPSVDARVAVGGLRSSMIAGKALASVVSNMRSGKNSLNVSLTVMAPTQRLDGEYVTAINLKLK